ncbi:hypothetical protein AQI70_29315 [Streptomyces curacoi]|uniref:Uncharacterized protein n=1 Tax=Streptomyces curacoi TaxID=146536 RepID=A0A117P0K6_9ACTN|nr:hypothetical protein AQI70_29315 [Streptomyces curacoi]
MLLEGEDLLLCFGYRCRPLTSLLIRTGVFENVNRLGDGCPEAVIQLGTDLFKFGVEGSDGFGWR